MRILLVPVLLVTAGLCAVPVPSGAADLVSRYFPMSDGATRHYRADFDPAFTQRATFTETTFRGRAVFALDSTGDAGDAILYLSYSGTALVIHGMTGLGVTLAFDQPLTLLDEQTLANGGTIAGTTTTRLQGVTVTVSLVSKVSPVGTVTVPYGGFGDCRDLTITITASVGDQSLSAQANAWVLAPDVGIIKDALAFYDGSTIEIVGYLELVSASTPCDLWSNATDVGGGWKWFSWFGFFNTNTCPWIYHDEHGSLYAIGTSTASIYLWDPGMMGFWWTSASTYPSVYRFADQSWLWYQTGSRDPRWFYNLSAGRWESW